MDKIRILAMLLLYRRIKRRRRNRIHRIRPIIKKRQNFGSFYTLFEDLRRDEQKFFNYFGLSTTSFDELHLLLKDSLQHQDTFMRECIQPIQMLAITIRYLASGCTFTDLHYSYFLEISTISKIVREVCCAIWSVMRSVCIPLPNKQLWESISQKFEQKANFPHCIGAVDGKRIRIVHPLKGCSSVVLMAVADADYRFVYVDIRSYGEDCDSNIWQNSSLWTSITNKELQLPEEKCLPGSIGSKVPYFLIGDDAFGLHRHLLKPYSGHYLTTKERIFNYRLSRAHRYVECAFGILSNKWRIFHRAINLDPEYVIDIVKACVVLHNFVRDRDGYEMEHTLYITGLENLSTSTTRRARAGLAANTVRNVLSDYFLTDIGALKWQLSKI